MKKKTKKLTKFESILWQKIISLEKEIDRLKSWIDAVHGKDRINQWYSQKLSNERPKF